LYEKFGILETIHLPRSFIMALLAFVYILGFIISPYWLIPQSTIKMAGLLGLIIGVGIIWIYLSTNSLEFHFNPRDYLKGGLILLGIILLNYRALNSVIPFRGDEGLHIDRTLVVFTKISLKWILGALLLFILFIYSSIKKPKWTVFIGIIIIAGTIWFFLQKNPFPDELKDPVFFVRYPFINYWLFVLAPKLASLISSPYHEFLYRIIPVLSMGSIAWSIQRRMSIPNLPMKIALIFSIATIPVVFYYSSILYIEPPAILLMTIVCLEINNLTHEDGGKLAQNPSWYTLILIGFIKETTLPFLLCFLVCREIVQLRKWFTTRQTPAPRNNLAFFLARESGVMFSVLAPAFLYLYFRTSFTNTRSYTPHILNLIDPSVYPIISRSLVEQFGLFLFFFIGGCILLMIRRKSPILLCHIALFTTGLAFYIMDNKVLIGYSRFNLFVLPPILAVASIFIEWIFLQKRVVGIGLVFSALFINLLISPVYLDGVKKPHWGNYLIDTSEHYYPYQDAIIWLKNNYSNGRILYTGTDYPYSFKFYWNKLAWHAKHESITTENKDNETIAVSKILDKAEKENFDFVVYRVLRQDFIQPQSTGEFNVKIIKNSAHILIIYYKDP